MAGGDGVFVVEGEGEGLLADELVGSWGAEGAGGVLGCDGVPRVRGVGLVAGGKGRGI